MRKNERKNLTTLVRSARLFQRSLIEWLDTPDPIEYPERVGKWSAL